MIAAIAEQAIDYGLLRSGFLVTLRLVVLAFALALAVGIVMASFRVSPVPPLRWLGTIYVEYFRNTPLLVLMLLVFFGLPKIGFLLSAFASAALALGLYTGAFVTETVRAGINSVERGQVEAARSVGLSFLQMMRLVVLPQAIRTVVPPLGNLLIACIKNSAIAQTIAVFDLMYQSDRIITDTAKGIQVGVAVIAAYLVLTIPAGIAVNVAERRLAIRR